MAIAFHGFHHAGFLVTDVEKSAHFYETVFGLQNLARPDFGFPGRWYDLGNGHQLHLMEVKSMPAHSTGNDRVDKHIAIRVLDLERAASELESLGIAFTRGGGTGGAQIFLRDPDGNLIELR